MTWIAAGVVGGSMALTAGTQYGIGKYNQKKNEKDRPAYEIPDEIKQNLSQAEQQALQGLPIAQQQQYIDSLQQSSAYALQQQSNRKGGLQGIAAINQQNIKGNQDLLAMNAPARMQNLDKLSQARQNMADYKQQSFQLNKLNPYYEKIASNQALNGALFQNLNNAVGAAGMIGANGMTKSANVPVGDMSAPNVNYQMSPYQFQSQNATSDPYSNLEAFTPDSGYNSGFNWSGKLK
jgi:hypothetical protein